MSAVTRAPPSGDKKVASHFSLSFERITVESLIGPWRELESTVSKLREKRSLVDEHTKLALEHLRSISVINAEVDCLEREFSANMARIVGERSSVQDKLRALVFEWEKSNALEIADRLRELRADHEAELSTMRDAVETAEANAARHARDVETLQKRNEELSHMLREYGIDTGGPLFEVVRARRQIESRRESVDTSVVNGVDAHSRTAEQIMTSEAEKLRVSVSRLQAELAATRAESRLREDEIVTLRSHHRIDETSQYATSVIGAPHSSSASFGASRQLFERTSQQSQSQSIALLGVDLGTRRQQLGLTGVHVVDVVGNGPAFLHGIRKNDVIVSWGGKTVHRLDDVAKASSIVTPNSVLMIGVVKNPPLNADIALSPVEIVTIHLDGRLDGPHNARREHFHLPKQGGSK